MFWKFRFWDYRWYQKAYDEIDHMEWPPEIAKFLKDLSKVIPEEWHKKMLQFVYKLYHKRGKEAAINFMKDFMRNLTGILND